MKGIALSLAACLLLSASLLAQEAPDARKPVAQAFIGFLGTKDFAGAEKLFDSQMSANLPSGLLGRIWSQVESKAGAFKEAGEPARTPSDAKVFISHCRFEKTELDLQVAVDATGKICGFFIRDSSKPVSSTPYSPPAYVDLSSFKDSDMTVGSGEWALPGTLSLPNGGGPFPCAVLVHGSGPNDRDETVMACKPFKDLAWGLASKGVAALRYEKRTRQHGAKLPKDITVKEESVDDVLEAVATLKKNPAIDSKRVFIVGHSLGGTLIPRIGARDESLAGFIVMAGANRPLEDLMLEQILYLSSPEGGGQVISKEEIAKAKEDVALVKSPSLSADMAPLGLPGSYWLDLRGYEPAKEALTLGRPIFILQGGRDAQVRMADFKGWTDALSETKGFSSKVYPGLNHFFIAGSGPSVPAEYLKPSHVDGAVVEDIAAWIKSCRN